MYCPARLSYKNVNEMAADMGRIPYEETEGFIFWIP